MTQIIWFRDDLRVQDNPALTAAVAADGPVIAVYVLDDQTPAGWRLGGAARWWLHQALVDLGRALAALNIPLVLRRGAAADVIPQLVAQIGARAVFWNRRYDPWAIAADTALKESLTAAGIVVHSSNGHLLIEPWQVSNKAGDPCRVFTPFWRLAEAKIKATIAPCVGISASMISQAAQQDAVKIAANLENERLAAWDLQPTKPDWAGGLRQTWGDAGAAAAWARAEDFLAQRVAYYRHGRDIPAQENTARLSPFLRFGQISVRALWHAVQARLAMTDNNAAAVEGMEFFLRELGWREFSYHLLYHFPHTPHAPLDPKFDKFPWQDDPAILRAWQRGQTGIPIVDAGMRQLWQTGWMHNRVRMIVGSLLVKNLLISWQQGAAWFWDTLVDADLANNTNGWQWVGGCGADASPYFRIFNPILQGEKFDPEGHYVRRFVPELARVPDVYLHKIWQAPPMILAASGVTLGGNYPRPIVDLATSRDRALAAFSSIKKESDKQD
jgi:deoxyribodipyrimidine photo-lyase